MRYRLLVEEMLSQMFGPMFSHAVHSSGFEVLYWLDYDWLRVWLRTPTHREDLPQKFLFVGAH